ncbi:MAG: ABC transporter ATP-binding protein [Thermoplasmata archaeon]|nr:ABC transporter ATP-binding protein [Thermoplasmata archaeon]
MKAISVRDLRKSYGDHVAVDGISFDVPEGSFFALLGPNGAGKSTTISIVCSLLGRDSGEVEVFGMDVSDPSVRAMIGVVFQDPMLDRLLTVRENLEVRGSMYNLEDLDGAVDRAVAAAGCGEFADQRYGTLSGGQRRRADIARALVHSPRLLILDEPTSGLDPRTRRDIWESVSKLNRETGMTVLLTTHYMEEASSADDVVVIDHGRIAAHGTPEQLKEAHSSDRMTVLPKDIDRARGILDDAGIAHSVERGVITIRLGGTAEAIPLVGMLKDEIESFEVRTGTMDEAFVTITGGDGE